MDQIPKNPPPGVSYFRVPPLSEMTHRIYGREKGTKRFSPLDVSKGNFVVNLIYATMFSEGEAKRVATKLTEENPDLEFQVRKI